MRWCCFLFWFVYRFTLACLAHFNWLTSIYVNCAYFVLWKSYDLLWFWMHLILCICFKPLRTENYLIVWCNLVRKRSTLYPNSTYKEIYMIEYGKHRKSKVQKELDKITEAEASDKEGESDDEEANWSTGDIERKVQEDVKINGTRSLAEAVRGEEERECMEQVFLCRAVSSTADLSRQFAVSADAEAPVPPPRFKKHAAKLCDQQNRENSGHLSIRERWRKLAIHDAILRPFRSCKQCAPCRMTRNSTIEVLGMDLERTSNELDTGNQVGLKGRIRRYLPLVRGRHSSPSSSDAIDILTPNFTNKRDLNTAREIATREKRDRKALTKRLRARRRAELAVIAKREAKQKTISNAIELLLQILRMMTSFAILVGNIRKTFIPAQFKWLKPGRNAYDNPELMMLWRCTVFLDVLLFWTNVIWAYCLQWHLCCRLGLLKFWSWVVILALVGGVFMLFPMSYVQDNLDISWCRFKQNSTLARYQPSW